MRNRKEKGMTLVALVITIVILLILARISILTLTNTGIFKKAKEAKGKEQNAEKEQSQTLSEYERELNKYSSVELTVANANVVLSKKENMELHDKKGNKIVIPAGFKVVVNDDTNNAMTVDKGIVIEDATDAETKGSQFVWVPVGNIKKDDDLTIEIALDRYTFGEDGTPTSQGEKTIGNFYMESISGGNSVAENISDFKLSDSKNNGYYIGRYEARKNVTSGSTTEIKADEIWNNITQPDAALQSKNMYKNLNFTSDLVNSYAWDTTIVFLQTMGENKKYSKSTSLNTETIAINGTDVDVQCNVFDMASNLHEWSTETSTHHDGPCVFRGGVYNWNTASVSYRDLRKETYKSSNFGFRPVLYINV